jgi:ABC-type Fe3+/spermidine/putrescine transport system ATPase subunit
MNMNLSAIAMEELPASIETNPKPQAAMLLEVSQLTKNYGSFQALRGISFDMRQGEIISVLGPSGCGKSTLLQLVAGLASPDEGHIKLDGRVIASSKSMLPPEKRGVNMVFQDYALWPHMNVTENIVYGLRRQRMDRRGIEQRLTELLELLHLEGLEHRLPPQLSGGQQQRVAIARALATRPNLMLLDEPLSNLDMRLRVEMRTEMAYLFRKLGISVFHVTHDPDEAFAMADRLLILRAGGIDQFGTPQQCYSKPASRWAASLLGAINGLRGTFVHTPQGAAIRIGELLLHGITPNADEHFIEGSEAILMFRPEEATILHDVNPDTSNALQAVVLHCTFEGIRWRSVIQTQEGQKQKLYVLHEEPVSPGDRIAVRLRPSSAFIYNFEEER